MTLLLLPLGGRDYPHSRGEARGGSPGLPLRVSAPALAADDAHPRAHPVARA